MHLLTSPTGRMSPVMYSIQLRTVEAWNGCLSDSSSQKNPLLYGSPHKKSAKIGSPTINEKLKSIKQITEETDFLLFWLKIKSGSLMTFN